MQELPLTLLLVDWRGVLSRFSEHLLDVLYPNACAICHRFIDGDGLLCGACEEQLQRLQSTPACRYCAKPLALDDAPCPWCTGRGVYPFDRMECLGVFDEPLRQLIHRIKYAGGWPLAERLADRLWSCPRLRELLRAADAIVAVPLHPRRQRKRGYNQAEVLASRLAHHAGLTLLRPLERLRDTPTQTQLRSQAARQKNVRGAFVLLDARCVRGRRLVLVDDVMTTGATLGEVARVLLPADPTNLSAMVVAVADPHGRDFQRV